MNIFIDPYNKNKKIEIIHKKSKYFPFPYIKVTGGDGTLLKSVHLLKHLNLPYFGKASGTRSFLMNPEPYIKKGFKIIKLKLIKATIITLNNSQFTVESFNEVMIGGDMNSWINFILDQDELKEEFKGGGIIISTPQGSTGVNRNNGGPILPIETNQWALTTDKCTKNLMYILTPKKITINVSSRHSIFCWIDGSNHIIQNVTSVILEKGSEIQLIINNLENFKSKRRKFSNQILI